jgi:2-dehydropantoate 2-reductase
MVMNLHIPVGIELITNSNFVNGGIVSMYKRSTIIQKTTIREIDGMRTVRIITFQNILKSAEIPTAISNNMDLWQKLHLALVTALANAYTLTAVIITQ